MTTYEKSRLLWIGGALLGAVGGYALGKSRSIGPVFGTAAGATLGAIVVGAGGDAILERGLVLAKPQS